MHPIILTTVFFSLLPGFLPDEPEWELAKEDEGIKVYTRYVENSEIRAFKAEAIMDGKLSEFVSVFKDVEHYPELFSNNDHASIIEMRDTIQWHYVITKTPWPLSNRDGVYVYKFHQNYQNKVVTVDVTADPDRLPENDGMIRIREAKGKWMLEPLDVNKVRVTFEMHAEPGGSVPDWIANMFIVDSPIKDFKRLRERVQLDQYKNHSYDFLVEY